MASLTGTRSMQAGDGSENPVALFWDGACTHMLPDDKEISKARVLRQFDSVSHAVDMLNADQKLCPEGICIVFSKNKQMHVVLYRSDKCRERMTLFDLAYLEEQVQRVKDAAEAEAKKKAIDDLVGVISSALPSIPKICILGGTKFNDAASKPLVKCLAQAFAKKLSGKVVVLTGGMPGVQETFALELGSAFPSLVHLLPTGEASNYGVGMDVEAGANLPERMDIFGKLGQVYLCIEGGPGVAKEARAAFERGAIVLPMISTGGASGGMFDFPAAALERLNTASADEWARIAEKGAPEATAEAVVQMIGRHLGLQLEAEQEAASTAGKKADADREAAKAEVAQEEKAKKKAEAEAKAKADGKKRSWFSRLCGGKPPLDEDPVETKRKLQECTLDI